uniref:Uncharacterized protein n=1 Tax=Cacopsylla melanoneura TaxID=428564 RepID=A0A8D8RG85_9HEMI
MKHKNTMICIKTMKKDDIYLMIIKDELILEYGSRIMERNETDENKHKISVDQSMRYHVGTKMREPGKLLAKLREKPGLNDKHLQFFLTHHHFFNLVEAVKELTAIF